MELVLATGNNHKRLELQEILKPHLIKIPGDYSIKFECEETGSTYLENALLKAQTLYSLVKMPVIADDSGLSVPALGGAPGVYSARYGQEEMGRMLESPERNQFLLNNMEGIKDRQAFFVCSIVLMLDPYRIYTVQETLSGSISEQPSGVGGFGYDPVFHLHTHGCTLAELSAEEKNSISHRGKAGKALADLLNQLQ